VKSVFLEILAKKSFYSFYQFPFKIFDKQKYIRMGIFVLHILVFVSLSYLQNHGYYELLV